MNFCLTPRSESSDIHLGIIKSLGETLKITLKKYILKEREYYNGATIPSYYYRPNMNINLIRWNIAKIIIIKF